MYKILTSAKSLNILCEDYAKIWDDMFKWREHRQHFTFDQLAKDQDMGQYLLNQYFMNKIGQEKEFRFLEEVKIIYHSSDHL